MYDNVSLYTVRFGGTFLEMVQYSVLSGYQVLLFSIGSSKFKTDTYDAQNPDKVHIDCPGLGDWISRRFKGNCPNSH